MDKKTRPSREILLRYFKGECLPHEEELVELYLSMDTDKDHVESCIAEAWDQLGTNGHDNIADIGLEKFNRELDQRKKSILQLPPLDHQQRSVRFGTAAWIRTVAASLLLIGGISLIFYNIKVKTTDSSLVQKQNDVLPGSDKALLRLSDGSTISLYKTKAGKIAVQDGSAIEKTRDGEIIYREKGATALATNAYNSIVTPNGGQYAVTLPDGSKARLNAGSSLTYPVHFSTRERRVRMTGEVYFEIAKVSDSKNKRIPFFVETDKQEIQVLGTVFNINAYADEPRQLTTLLEGSVRLRSAANHRYTLLNPGERAVVGNTVTVTQADIKQDIAWVNGNFIFKREELGSILRKISRWYDLEVECPTELTAIKFTGKVSRSQPLSAVIEMLSATNKIHVQLKERRIIVTK